MSTPKASQSEMPQETKEKTFDAEFSELRKGIAERSRAQHMEVYGVNVNV